MNKLVYVTIISLLHLFLFSSCKKDGDDMPGLPALLAGGQSTTIPFLAFTNSKAASVVIGQPDFTSNTKQ